MVPCFDTLICPVCTAALHLEERSLVCPAGHRFDIARQGYVNLLGGSARPATLGDTAEMLRARRAFLDRGHYAPLADALATLARDQQQGAGEDVRLTGGERGAERAPMQVDSEQAVLAEALPETRPRAVLDAGCGEGTYLAAVAEALGEGWCAIGVDVAKDAARMAAGRHRRALFVVADTWQRLPLMNGAVDLLINVFAPRNGPEFGRLVRPVGRLLVAVPRQEHLAELRGSIPLLGIEPDKPAGIAGQLVTWFTLERQHALTWQLKLTADDLTLLAAMTPGSRHAAPRAAPVPTAGPAHATAAVDLLLFRRNE